MNSLNTIPLSAFIEALLRGEEQITNTAIEEGAELSELDLPLAEINQKIVRNYHRHKPLILSKVHLTEVNLADLHLPPIKAEKCSFFRCIFTGLQASHGEWVKTRFEHCNFARSNLRECHMVGCHLAHNNLEEAELQGINLWKASVRENNFLKAAIHEGILAQSDLSFSDFTQASLHKVNFWQANLHQVSFKWAKLTETVLKGAENIHETRSLHRAHFKDTRVNQGESTQILQMLKKRYFHLDDEIPEEEENSESSL